MRLFIAVRFSPEIEALLLDAVRQVREQVCSGNFTRPENLHLTLAFIGESERLPEVKEAIDKAATAAFPLTVGGGGRFGSLYWVGVEQHPALARLTASIRRELELRKVDFDRKPFKPHITIARQVEAERPLALDVPRLSMTVRRVSLMKSERLSGRLVYTEVYGKNLR